MVGLRFVGGLRFFVVVLRDAVCVLAAAAFLGAARFAGAGFLVAVTAWPGPVALSLSRASSSSS